MNTATLSNALAFFSAVAYGIHRDHPAVATARTVLRQALQEKVAIADCDVTVQTLADRALDSASAAGDTETVRDLLALGAGATPAQPTLARPIVFAYREAVRNGHNDTARELAASGLVPDWA